MLEFCNNFAILDENYYEDIDDEVLLSEAFNYILEKLGSFDKETCNISNLTCITGNNVMIFLKLFEDSYVVKQINYLKENFFMDLQEGDKILSINGTSCSKFDIEDMIKFINCLEKTKEDIKLCFERNGIKKEVVIEAKQGNISDIVTNEYKINDKAIGYIKLSLFDNNSAEEFEEKLSDLEWDIDSLIIDLRNNIGGIKEEVIDTISLFLDENNVIFTEESQGEKEMIYSNDYMNRKYPIVILINSISSWCSEIITSALMEKCGAISIGTTTSGQSLITSITTNNTDKSKYNFCIPTAKWYTTKDVCVQGHGIVPTIKVEYELYKDGMDSQLKAALEYLSDK